VSGRQDLTVGEVEAVLTKSGVDYSALEIYHDPAVWTNLETGAQRTSVVIKGPKEARRQASRVLYERGLSNARYPDLDMWSRP
jgi:hypothetical protein